MAREPSAPPDFDHEVERWLGERRAAGLERRCPQIQKRRGVHYELDGRPVVGFCSNDYLDVADTLPEAPGEVAGASASRLIVGDVEVHREVEALLAEVAGTEDAVLFPSGFQLNVGCLPALLRRDDRVHSDRLNHASLIDGLRLASPRPTILEHLSTPSDAPTAPTPIDRAARTRHDGDGTGRSWWITESVFSMDGDSPRLDDLEAHQAAGGQIYLDEAHAFGLATGGAGMGRALASTPTAAVLTLGKAFGVAGAGLGASASVCRWLRATSRSFVFSTGVSPRLARQIVAAIELVRGDEGDRRRESLARNCAAMHRALFGHTARSSSGSSENRRAALGPVLGGDAPHIIPLLVGGNETALALSSALLDDGFHVQAIRPPTVEVGRARLRLTLSAGHTPDQIQALAEALHRRFADAGLPLRSPAAA